MDQDRWEILLEGALNDTLNPEEERELLSALRDDAAREAQLLHLFEQDELLSAALNRARSGESFEEQVRVRVRGRDGAPFVNAVLDRVRRGPTRRRTHPRKATLPAGAWKVALLAACLVFGVVTLLIVSSSAGDRSVSRRKSRGAAERQEVPAPAEEKRREMEARLREIERKREELSKPEARPAHNPVDEEEHRNALQALKDEKNRIEEEMRRAIELAKPAGPTEPPRPPPALPAPKLEGRTEAGLARLEEVAGEAFVVTKEGTSRAKSGADLTPAQGLETGGGASRVVLLFPDQTRVELGPDTTVSEVKVESGKRVIVAKGAVRAEVTRQPKDKPMVFATPHAEAKVLGTTLRLLVDPDPKKGTRLEVEEGRVELKTSAGRTVEVPSGHFAVAAVGITLAAKPASGETSVLALLANAGEVTISFGVPGRKLPPGILIDSGEPFDARRGYGWQGANDLMKVPGADPVPRRRPHSGEGPDDQDLRGSRLNGGGVDTTELWIVKVPKGKYLVTVCAGSYTAAGKGPHHVQVEGTQVIEAVKTLPGEFVEKKEVPVEVKDGVLRVMIGGHRRKDFTQVPWYGPDTAVNFIKIKKAQP